MADLGRLQILLQTFRGQVVVPDATVEPEVQELQDITMNIGDYFGPSKQTIAADASDVALTLPNPPYDAVTYFDCVLPVEINVNGGGWQTVKVAWVSMAPVTSLHVRNLLVTAPNLATVPIAVRIFCAKVAS